MLNRLLCAFMGVVPLFVLAGSAVAGTIRHDRSIAGYRSLGSRYTSVGEVNGRDGYGGWSGSGVLIGGRWAITAAHVAEGADELRFAVGGRNFNARRWYINPQWNGDLLNGGDLAIIEFDQNITSQTGIRPAKRYGGAAELGNLATFAGFGRTGDGLSGDTDDNSERLAGRNYLDAYGSWLGGGKRANGILLADFDNRRQTADENLLGSARRDKLEYLIASGDSGGGVFMDVNGQERLVGIHSFVFANGLDDYDPDSDYGDGSGHTRVGAYKAWINAVLGGDAIESAIRPASSSNGPGGTLDPSRLVRWNMKTVALTTPEPATILAFGLPVIWAATRRSR